MSIAIDPKPGPRPLRQIVEWLREARSAAACPGIRISGMSDKELRDIGLKPRSLTSTVYHEIGKTGLVDFNWRLGR